MRDPGLDRHQWESEWQQLEPLLEDAPAEALPELADLVERMLVELEIPIHDDVADDGIEPELVRDFQEARRISDLVDRGEDVSPGDIGEAIHSCRRIYESLINELRT
ncbi:MAG: hypothetical protein M3327_15995 [Actinomycetota bacterium]|nr:hypothetical protein [Actinomycetota bacterium]